MSQLKQAGIRPELEGTIHLDSHSNHSDSQTKRPPFPKCQSP